MNWKKMTVTALIGLGVVGVLAGCGNDAKPAAADTKLPTKVVVGLDDNFPPMGFRNEKAN